VPSTPAEKLHSSWVLVDTEGMQRGACGILKRTMHLLSLLVLLRYAQPAAVADINGVPISIIAHRFVQDGFVKVRAFANDAPS
jgi:hypothetical protein